MIRLLAFASLVAAAAIPQNLDRREQFSHLSLKSSDGRCLAPEGLWNGAALTLVDCQNPNARLLQRSDRRIVVQSRTDLCLDVRDGVGGWQGRLQMWECGTGNGNQEFSWGWSGGSTLHWQSWCVGTLWDNGLVAGTVGCGDPSAKWDAVVDKGYWG